MARYQIVPDRSRVWIDARSTLHPIHSTTDGLEGYVDFDGDGEEDVDDPGPVHIGDHPVGQLSLPVSRLSSGNGFEDRELYRRIDARKFPTIDGVLTGMERLDGAEGQYTVTGDLVFRGVTKSCADAMNITRVDDRTIRLDGRATFDIREFGMEAPRIMMLRVEPDVDVRVEILATRQD